MCFRVIIIFVHKQELLHILIVYMYRYLSSMQSASAVLYCSLLPVMLYHIFPHYLLNGTILGEKILNMKYMCSACIYGFMKHFLSTKIERYITTHENTR
jgi:hypothetical protein